MLLRLRRIWIRLEPLSYACSLCRRVFFSAVHAGHGIRIIVCLVVDALRLGVWY